VAEEDEDGLVVRLVAARDRPPPDATPHELTPIAGRIWSSEGALVIADDEAYLHLGHDFEQAPLELSLEAAELVELLLDGHAPATLRVNAERRDFGAGALDALVAVVAGWVKSRNSKVESRKPKAESGKPRDDVLGLS